MKKLHLFFPLCLLAVLLSGCYTNRQIGYLQTPTKANKLPVYDSVAYTPYRLQVNDEIIYRLVSMDETISKTIMSANGNVSYQYANSYRIHPDGTIDVPFIRPVYILGMTVEEAQVALREAFREIIPDADVKLALYNKYFTVIGDIASGEYYIYKDKLNIFEALALTGDLRTSGDRQHVRILRPQGDGKEPEVLEFDLRSNTIIDSKYYYVYPNDVIYVARTKAGFYKVTNYSSFLGIVTTSVAFLTTVLTYYNNFTPR